jgi:hypothetical protein
VKRTYVHRPRFAGRTLDSLRGLRDEDILAIKGIGPATLRKIHRTWGLDLAAPGTTHTTVVALVERRACDVVVGKHLTPAERSELRDAFQRYVASSIGAVSTSIRIGTLL